MLFQMKDTLLLVGDANSDRSNLRAIFTGAYHLLEAENANQAIMLLGQNSECVAAILADIPVENTDDLRKLVEASHPGTDNEIPVLMFVTPTGTGTREDHAFLLGATDVVLRPYTNLSVQRRVQVLAELFHQKWSLKKLVEEQNETIRNSNQLMLDALSTIIEHRNTESGNHVLRIRRFTEILLKEVVRSCPEYGLDDTDVRTIASAATLHDIGKISIPDGILNKPGRLTEEEFAVMRTHTTIGSQLVEQLAGLGDMDFLRYAYNIALYHHERWDGGGYPCGLKGDDIPICAQVVSVADAFDALISVRPYKPAYPCEVAVNMILRGECGTFSPKLLECFKHVHPELADLARRYSDGYSPKSDDIKIPLPKPVHPSLPLDSLQLSQAKFQTMLHYANDTVVELDVDNQLYHVVYNPNPNFESLLGNASFQELFERLVRDGVHPEGMDDLEELKKTFSQELFQQNLRRQCFTCQVFSPSLRSYTPYEVTILRVNTENTQQRILLAIFHQRTEEEDQENLPEREKLPATHALYTLTCAVLRCQTDDPMTIDLGAKNLFYLTGYRPDEISCLFGNSLMDLVIAEDQTTLMTLVQDCIRYGNRTEAEFRLLCKSKDPVLVLCKGLVCTEDDGSEYLYLTLTDISFCNALQRREQSNSLRNQIIIDQTDGIVFDWDLLRDTMTCSDKWEKRFGYTPLSTKFSLKLDYATHFHPDDLPLLREKAQAIHTGSSTVDLEVRIANQEGKYMWSRICATALYNSSGDPIRIVGLITDINDQKMAALSLKEQAERDTLTNLYNKSSAQQLIGDYLTRFADQEMSCVLLLDLDNFKTVNDNYGHMYGDALLVQVSTTLRQLFRTQDIIARIGGDEFMVLMKGIPSEEVLNARCDLLLDTLRDLFRKLMPDLSLSCSVGCALVPNHGTTFKELYRNADRALYGAKARGKDQYLLYDPQAQYNDMRPAPRATRVESDEGPAPTGDFFIHFVFHRLYESRNISATVNELLAFVGARFNISRVYIFENNDDNTACSNTFEWCNVGIPPAQAALQNVSYLTDVPGWVDLYDEGGKFYCADVTQLPDRFRSILEAQGIRSVLSCAMMDAGRFRGFVGYDECTSTHFWTKNQIATLEFLAKVLSVFLLKHRAQQGADVELSLGPGNSAPSSSPA